MLKQQIQADVKDAMRQGNQKVVEVLRMALSVMSAKEKEKRYVISKDKPEIKEEDLIVQSGLQDTEVIDVMVSEIKKRKDAIVLYDKGARPELADKEKAEIEILQKYLPEQLSPDELKKLIEQSIEKTGAKEIKDMGKIMADLMPKVKGKADNSEISNIIKEIINGK